MAGPTFILSIWVLVDGALGTKDSIGAAAHTVRPISKMGTLSTSIRALGRREKGGQDGIPKSMAYLPARTNPAILGAPSIDPRIIWPPCVGLGIWLYHSQDLQVLPLPPLP